MNVARLCALGLALLVAPCSAVAADPLTIDVVIPLTGANSFIGQGLKKGYEGLQKAVNDAGGVNGRQLAFTFHDDQTSPQTDVQLVSEIIARKATVILGPASTAGCRAVLPLVKDGPLLYCLSPSINPPSGSYAFSVNVATIDSMGTAIHYFMQRGAKRIATITSIDANGQDADTALDTVLANLKAPSLLVDREHFGNSDISVSAQASRIKAANPDLIVAWTTGTPFGTILHSFKDVGLDVPLLTTNANSNRGILAQLASLMPKELYFPDPVTEIKVTEILDPRTRREVESYHTAMNAVGVSQPDVPNGAGWDAGHLILEAYRKIGASATSAQIRDYIAGTKGWVGIRGPYDFRAYPQRGLSQPAVVMVRWDATAGEWNAVSRPGGVPLR